MPSAIRITPYSLTTGPRRVSFFFLAPYFMLLTFRTSLAQASCVYATRPDFTVLSTPVSQIALRSFCSGPQSQLAFFVHGLPLLLVGTCPPKVLASIVSIISGPVGAGDWCSHSEQRSV